jgi:quercetin dioxygenase-like cupin family protein
MADLIERPTLVNAAGRPPKRIEEFIGRLSTGTGEVSIARMQSPPGWREPGQTPEFDEYTTVLAGRLLVETEGGVIEVGAGQAIRVRPGEWVRYSTPDGAEYISVCLPAFSPVTAHRDRDLPGSDPRA